MTSRRVRLSCKKKNAFIDCAGEDDALLVKCITDNDVGKIIVGEEYCPREKVRRNPKEGDNEDVDGEKLNVSSKKNRNISEISTRHSVRKSLRATPIRENGDINEKLERNSSVKRTPTSVRKRGKSKQISEETSESDEEFNHGNKEQCERPSGLCDEEDVAGDEICSFRTPKKRQGMYQKALESAGKTSSVRTPTNTSRTPSRALTPSTILTPSHKNTPKKRMSVLKLTPSTRASLNKNSALKKAPPVNRGAETPYNLRARHKKEIRAYMRSIAAFDDAEDSDYESSDDSSSDSEGSGSAEEGDSSSDSGKGSEGQKPVCRRSLRYQIPSSNKKKIGKETNYVFTADDYFESQGGKCSTSDRKLSRLQTPRLDSSALHDLLSHCSLSHAHVLANRRADDIAMFKRWMFMLSQGFSILAYGLGSKFKILQNFHREMLSESYVMVVNGFFPSLNIKEVVETIARDFLGLKQMLPSSHAIIDWIESRYRMPRVFLIVHNLDAEALRCEKTQRVLSRLASLPKVHLIASVDHINCPLLWDQAKLSGFNFMWEDTTSFLPYREETSYETSLLVQNSGSLALSSLLSVYRSLTQNARGVFRIILEKHLEENSNKYIGMAFSALYKKCRDEMLVTNDVILRSILAEFLDHQMVKWRRDCEHLHIPVDTGVLQQFHTTISSDV